MEEKTQPETNVLNKDFSTFKIDDLIKSTFKKIAEWHNDDSSAEGLRLLVMDISEEHLTAAFKHLGLEVTTNVQLDMTPEEKQKFDEEKSKLQKNQQPEI